jgi:hypothetical protein
MKQDARAAAAIPLLLTGCLWAVRAEAQESSEGVSGHFTLPYAAEWAGRTLAPAATP